MTEGGMFLFEITKKDPTVEALIDIWLADDCLIRGQWLGKRLVKGIGQITQGPDANDVPSSDEFLGWTREWRERPLVSEFPYIFLGGLTLRQIVGVSVTGISVLTAIGVAHAGRCEILAVNEGDKKSKDDWAAFLGRLRDRGLKDVRLVISERYPALAESLPEFYPYAFWAGLRDAFPRCSGNRTRARKG
jgi:hypothetical protein